MSQKLLTSLSSDFVGDSYKLISSWTSDQINLSKPSVAFKVRRPMQVSFEDASSPTS